MAAVHEFGLEALTSLQWLQLRRHCDSTASRLPEVARRSNRSRVAVVTYYITRFDGSDASPITDTAELKIQEIGSPAVQVQN